MEFSETIKETGYELSVRKIKEKVFISIANYPTHSKELIEMFSDRILAL
jgi:hypothetical protein